MTMEVKNDHYTPTAVVLKTVSGYLGCYRFLCIEPTGPNKLVVSASPGGIFTHCTVM